MLHSTQMMNIKQKIFFFATLFSTLLMGAPAFADNITSINVQTLNPSTSDHFVFLEDGYKSEWPKVAKYYLGANFNFVTEPFVVLDASQTTKAYNIIDSIETLDLFFGFKAANNLGLFIGAPLHFVNYSSFVTTNFPNSYPTRSVTAFGDVKILAKIRLTNDVSNTSVALIPEFHLPTGNTQNFVSDASTYVGLRLAVERQFDTFTLITNLGYAAAGNSIYNVPALFPKGLDYRKRLIFGIGGLFPLGDQWGINAEFNNINMIPLDSGVNPTDAYLGLRYVASDGLIFTGGASTGKIGGAGGANTRGVVGIRYTIQNDAKTPIATNTNAQISPALSKNAPSAVTAPPVVVIESTPRVVMQTQRIEILRPIQFENDSYRLLPDSKQTLDDIATLMLKHKDAYKKVLVDGHTSSVGTDKYNVSLSLARARAVKTYIVTKGVGPAFLEARGFGLRKPKVPVTDPNSAEINRRVEFLIIR